MTPRRSLRARTGRRNTGHSNTHARPLLSHLSLHSVPAPGPVHVPAVLLLPAAQGRLQLTRVVHGHQDVGAAQELGFREDLKEEWKERAVSAGGG